MRIKLRVVPTSQAKENRWPNEFRDINTAWMLKRNIAICQDVYILGLRYLIDMVEDLLIRNSVVCKDKTNFGLR
jgi:hypothetical protein